MNGYTYVEVLRLSCFCYVGRYSVFQWSGEYWFMVRPSD